MSSTFLRTTKRGPIDGFADTLPQRKQTAYTGETGSEMPIDKWLGVPYGEARRFEHVRPPLPWSEPFPCYDYGPMPLQPPSFFNTTFEANVATHISRDQHLQAEEGVHTVNVFAPHGVKEGDKLPVLVWIYGGSLNTGSSGLFTGDPTNWLRRSIADGKPFIFVSGNYRTNVFGFLAHKDLQEADPQGLAGNFGLRDALAIFSWVQDNIAAFGGDTANVNGFGESAGAFIISQLLFVNNGASALPKRRIMRRAIMQSGAPATLAANRIEDAYPLYDEMLKHFGIDDATAQERVESLRLVPFTELSNWVNSKFQLGQWTLTIEEGEHAIWNESTASLLEKGVYDESIEAVITGINENEGSMFSSQLQTPEAYSSMLSRFPESVRPAIEQLYPVPTSAASYQIAESSAAQLLGDRIFEAPCLRFAQQFSQRTPTYLYKLRGGVHAILDGLKCGVIHTQDLHLLFNLHNYWSADSEEARLSKAMGDAWVDFATSGRPGREWQPYNDASPAWLAFKQDGTTDMEDITGYKAEKMALWIRMQVEQAAQLSKRR